MAHDAEDIDKKLSELLASGGVEKSARGPVRCWWVVLGFMAWVVVIGMGVLVVLYGLKYGTANKDLDTAQSTERYYSAEYSRAIKAISDKTIQRDKLTKDRDDLQNQTKVLREQVEALQKDVDALALVVQDLNNTLDAEKKKRDDLKKQNDVLRAENNQLTHELKQLTDSAAALNATLKLKERAVNYWKLGTLGGFFATILGAMDAVYTHTRHWELQARQKAIAVERASMEAGTTAFETSLYLEHIIKESISRTVCFHGTNRDDLRHCEGKAPTVTTITTTSGYRFGVLLSIPWTTQLGAHADPKALAFSSHFAQPAPIKESGNAFIVSNSTLLQFGSTDIIIHLLGKTGTSHAASYDTKAHPVDKFFHDGPEYAIKDIVVEYLTFSQHPNLTPIS